MQIDMEHSKIVIIPTYNEKENIEKIIRKVRSLDGDFHILIVDDGSPDGTGAIVKGLQKEFSDTLFIIERSGKLGLGTAYIAGFKWCLEHGYDYIFEMDADFSHNPEDLIRLYNACASDGADISIGSRYVEGIAVRDWPLSRIMISYGASFYVRTVLGMKVYDSTAGFVCYSRKVLETIDLDRIRMKGYGFQIEMKYNAYRLGFNIKEVPIIFTDRKEGKSKMSSSIFGEAFRGVIALRFRKGKTIASVMQASDPDYGHQVHEAENFAGEVIIGGSEAMLLPGVIDDQVHFREPGATRKGCIASESAAAVLGGVTSFMDMPNNNPPATTVGLLESKYDAAARESWANYSFYIGATNDNIEELRRADRSNVCGIKVFMGSSTGNMLVDSQEALDAVFSLDGWLIATHCEDEATIRHNLEEARARYGDSPIPFSAHPLIRSREACLKSSAKAVELARRRYGTRLHVLHVSTAEEIDMLSEAHVKHPGISAEVCVHYMWFDDRDYDRYGSLVKCNPAIKTQADRKAITAAVREGLVQAVATDHAPHLLGEKMQDYLHAPSGLPTVQHSLVMMLQLAERGCFPVEQVVQMMSHSPADLFRIDRRGYIREGYFADLVIVRRRPWTVSKDNIAYRCGWSPLEGTVFDWAVTDTFVNGTRTVRDSRLTGLRNPARLHFRSSTT